MKLTRADIEIIELQNKVETLINKQCEERLKKVLNKNERLISIRKVKANELS